MGDGWKSWNPGGVIVRLIPHQWVPSPYLMESMQQQYVTQSCLKALCDFPRGIIFCISFHEKIFLCCNLWGEHIFEGRIDNKHLGTITPDLRQGCYPIGLGYLSIIQQSTTASRLDFRVLTRRCVILVGTRRISGWQHTRRSVDASIPSPFIWYKHATFVNSRMLPFV